MVLVSVDIYDLGISGHFWTENHVWELGVIQNLLRISLIFLVWFFGLKSLNTSKSYTTDWCRFLCSKITFQRIIFVHLS